MEKNNERTIEVSNLATYLGRYPVPVTSSRQGLLAMIDRFRDDEPFVTAILERSVIEFSRKEEGLKDRVIKDAEVKKNFGCSVLFDRSLAELKKALETRMEQEIEFYRHRKAVQSRMYDILVQSAFPYSTRQAECLHTFRKVIDHASGNPDTEADEVIVASVKELLRLMEDGDHFSDTSPFRAILRSTVPFHLSKILEKLRPLFQEELRIKAPDFDYPMATVGLAGFMIARIEALMEAYELLAPHEYFRMGMFEVYDKMMRIFKFSGLRLTDWQERAFLKVEEETIALEEGLLSDGYEQINQAWCRFMTRLERDVFRRELTRGEDGRMEFAYYDPVHMSVREISWRLVHLMPVADAHLFAFPLFNFGRINMVTKVTERFLAIYPMR